MTLDKYMIRAGAAKIGGGSTFTTRERLEMSRDIITAAVFAHLPAGSEAVKAVAQEWRALEDGDPRTSWYPVGYGDEAGWKKLADSDARFAVERRDLFAAPPSTPPAANVQDGEIDHASFNAGFTAGMETHERMAELLAQRDVVSEAGPLTLAALNARADAARAALEWAVEALRHSEPKASHYPEPVERHKQALDHCKNAIEHLSGRSKQATDGENRS